jgi:hypothetical protein
MAHRGSGPGHTYNRSAIETYSSSRSLESFPRSVRCDLVLCGLVAQAWRSNSQLESNDELRSEHLRVATVFQSAPNSINTSAFTGTYPVELPTPGLLACFAKFISTSRTSIGT